MVRWNRSPEMESFFFKVWDSFSASLKVQQPYIFIAVHCILGMGSCSVRLRYTQVRLKSGLKYTNQCFSFSLMKTRNRAKQFSSTINQKGYFSSLLLGKTLKSFYVFNSWRSPIFSSSQSASSLSKFRAVSHAEFPTNIVYCVVLRYREKLVTLEGFVREARKDSCIPIIFS